MWRIVELPLPIAWGASGVEAAELHNDVVLAGEKKGSQREKNTTEGADVMPYECSPEHLKIISILKTEALKSRGSAARCPDLPCHYSVPLLATFFSVGQTNPVGNGLFGAQLSKRRARS